MEFWISAPLRRLVCASLIVLAFLTAMTAQNRKPRARDLGVPFDGTPGKFNAITDVTGVEVGYSTLIIGEGNKAVRTGVTAILPKGREYAENVFGAWHTLNGNGEMTGTTWLEESGSFGGPVMITNTNSVGTVRDAVVEWGSKKFRGKGYSGDFSLPVVAETWDGFLNDINGFHVKKEHAFQALESAAGGRLAEGNVGGGTGMVAHQFKGGTGTASRVLSAADGGYVVGVLVQANYGGRSAFKVAGVPVGREITDLTPVEGKGDADSGSIIVVIATDAPLLPHQLKRVAQRAGLAVGMMGGIGANSSGDIFIAFSVANAKANSNAPDVVNVKMLPNDRINPVFLGAIQATEEAIVNAMVAAETMTGYDGNKVFALPHDRLKEALRKFNRLN